MIGPSGRSRRRRVTGTLPANVTFFALFSLAVFSPARMAGTQERDRVDVQVGGGYVMPRGPTARLLAFDVGAAFWLTDAWGGLCGVSSFPPAM